MVERSPVVDGRTTGRLATDIHRSGHAEVVHTVSRPPGLTSKEAEEVAAAVRFRREVEKPRLTDDVEAVDVSLPHSSPGRRGTGGNASALATAADVSPGIHKSRLASARDSQAVMRKRKKKMLERPAPLMLDNTTLSLPSEVRSATTASEASRPAFYAASSCMEDEDSPLRRRKTVSDLRQDSLKTRRNRRQFHVYQKNGDEPPLPPLWTTRSDLFAGAELHENAAQFPPQPAVDDVEAVALTDVAPIHTLSSSAMPIKRKTSSMVSVVGSKRDDPFISISQITQPATECSAPASSKNDATDLKRKWSLFRWLQRRSELDELIDMYMDDQRVSAGDTKGKSSGSRLPALWPSKTVTEPLKVRDNIGLT